MNVNTGDVLIYQTADNGEITVDGGLVAMTNGFDSAVYLSMFGGNEDDNGLAGNELTWWGNVGIKDSEQRMASQTQNILRGLPVSSSSLAAVKNAIQNDLAWMKKYTSDIDVSLAIVGPKRIQIAIGFLFNNEQITLTYLQNWEPA